MKRVFVIAMECEADCVRPHLNGTDELIVCGIGKVNAAAAAQKAISEFDAELVVNAGLAGGFGGLSVPPQAAQTADKGGEKVGYHRDHAPSADRQEGDDHVVTARVQR
jgi:hypothetical protein